MRHWPVRTRHQPPPTPQQRAGSGCDGYLIGGALAPPLAWPVPGWNVSICHSRPDVHPYTPRKPPFRFGWHPDSGRRNREP